MTPWLSIIIPSLKPEGYQHFLNTLTNRAYSMTGVEIIPDFAKAATISEVQARCLEKATGEWCFLANDDVTVETDGWDQVFSKATRTFEDGVGLFWPNDGMFEDYLACFPLIRTDILRMIFPLPYHKYKVDDTIFQCIPPKRRVYMPEVTFRHHNDQGTEGFKLPSGGVYPIDPEVAEIDGRLWLQQATRRQETKVAIAKRISNA